MVAPVRPSATATPRSRLLSLSTSSCRHSRSSSSGDSPSYYAVEGLLLLWEDGCVCVCTGHVSVGFLFGLHQGTRIGVLTCLLLMIRNFNRLKRISTMNNRSRVRLLALTVRECGQSLHRARNRDFSFAARRVCPTAGNSSSKPGSSGWFTFQELVPTPPRHRSMSASVAKANWPSGPRSQMHFSSARR